MKNEKIDKKIALIKRQQAEMEHRNRVEKQAEQLICEGKYKEAIALLNSLDDSILPKLQAEFKAIEVSETDTEREEKSDIKEMEIKIVQIDSHVLVEVNGEPLPDIFCGYQIARPNTKESGLALTIRGDISVCEMSAKIIK